MTDIMGNPIQTRYPGKCPKCGEEDRRIDHIVGYHSNGASTQPLVWCPDCMHGVIAWWPKEIMKVDHIPALQEKRAEIMAERKAEIQQLRDEHKRYKDALDLIGDMCKSMYGIFEATDETDDVFDTVCDAFGLDMAEEREKAETKGRKEMMEDEDDDSAT